jgi:GT2 family glycosyltransferase
LLVGAPTPVLVVIVNYRSAELAVDCIKALMPEIEDMGGIRVVIVDNCSPDNSVEIIGRAIDEFGWQPSVELIQNDINGGFAAGNNVAVREALNSNGGAEYVFLLNPDTIPENGVIAELVHFMEANQQIGITGVKVLDKDGEVLNIRHRFPTPMREFTTAANLGLINRLLSRWADRDIVGNEPQDADWVSGSSMFIRRKVYEQIGLMDEGYFLYFEEVDFCYRAKQANWEIFLLPSIHVTHFEGASTGINNRGRRMCAWYDSRRRFLLKAHGLTGLFAADILWAIGRLIFLIRRVVYPNKEFRIGPEKYAYDLLIGDIFAVARGEFFRLHSTIKTE